MREVGVGMLASLLPVRGLQMKQLCLSIATVFPSFIIRGHQRGVYQSGLKQGLINFLCKGPESKLFWRPYDFYHNHSTLLLQHESSRDNT